MPRTHVLQGPLRNTRVRAVVAPVSRVRGPGMRAIYAATPPFVIGVRASFEREHRRRRAIYRERPAERKAQATGFRRRSIARLGNGAHRDRLRSDGTPERRETPNWVPAEELVRVREAFHAQYDACTLPTLDKLEFLVPKLSLT